mgnify:CR=1 FL=1
MVTTEINYEKAFELFIGKDELRPMMHKPFKQQGFYFATDAMGLIYMPTNEAELNYEEQDKPSCFLIVPKKEDIKIEININEIEAKLIPELIDEMIIKQKEIECKECDGEGSLECDLGHDHECSECYGTGEVESEIKEPTGNKIPNPDKQFIMFDVYFAYWQLKRLIDTCKVLGVEQIIKTNGNERQGNVFNLGKVNVMIMPLSIHSAEISKAVKIF